LIEDVWLQEERELPKKRNVGDVVREIERRRNKGGKGCRRRTVASQDSYRMKGE
jgi:hypothetical protein